jgi:ABC-type transport system involved in cytochrome c biogenesis ATPase subunit
MCYQLAEATAPSVRTSGYLMIRSIEIKNFRCFDHLRIDDCRRVNVIVGDNGSGKTALLEAIFLALGTTTELAQRYRQQRGLNAPLSGSPRRVEEALWGDLFYKHNWDQHISVELTGDGPEARLVKLLRGPSSISISPADAQGERITTSLTFQWRDSDGHWHSATPKLSEGRFDFPSTDEDLPDFFFFAANMTVSPVENAGRFSDLSQANRLGEFVATFTSEYNWIKDLSLEVLAGSPVVYATLRNGEKLPVPNVSGGINRVLSFLLPIASRPRSVTLIDEAENGIYYKHHQAFWSAILSLTRKYEGQIFLATHNEEWLEALAIASAASGLDQDISLWRIERGPRRPVVYQFTGEQVIAGIRVGEVR